MMLLRATLTAMLALLVALSIGCRSGAAKSAEEISNRLTPEEFFAANRPGRPTALFMIGLSGSGKSTWSRAAEQFAWLRIDSDQLLLDEMGRMATAGEVAEEVASVPDPNNSAHFFKLRERGLKQAHELFERATAQRHSFVWDSVGLNEFKTTASVGLRAKGYEVWWLIFHPDGIEKNRFNLFLRESKGGFGSFKGYPLAMRCEALNRMLTKQLETLQTIEAQLERGRPNEVDRVFRVEVKDLRPLSQVVDPCLDLPPGN